jgi:RimJ/RimL family protein N-acetyltransferase
VGNTGIIAWLAAFQQEHSSTEAAFVRILFASCYRLLSCLKQQYRARAVDQELECPTPIPQHLIAALQARQENDMTTHAPGVIVLRDVIESDLPIFFEHQLDPVATRMAAFPSRDRPAFMSHWAKILANQSGVVQTIMLDDQVAGNILSYEYDGVREVGYWIGRQYWGQGVATRALSAFLERHARPLYAHVAKHNRGSLRVLEKCGFTIVGEDSGQPDATGVPVEEYVLKLSADEPRQ